MGDKRFLWVLLALVIVLLGSGAAVGQASGPPPKTKLCGNDDCTEVLFEGTVNRPQQGTHSEFLHYPDVGATIKVYAIKFSDRTDLWEGGIDDEASEKSRGFFYSQHVNIDGYLNFLRNAVKQNKTLFVHNQLAQMKYKSLLGTKQAMPELIKDLEVTERRYAAENNLPEPEPLDLAALGFQVENGHGHSHGGHGHSHGGHGHSHGGHGHSHDAHDAHGHSHGGHDHSHDDHNHGHSHEAPASDAKPKVEQNALRRNMQQQAGSNPQPKPDPVPQPTPVVADPKPTLTPSQVPTPTEAPQTVKAVKPPSTTGEPKPAVTNDVPEVKPAVVKDVPEVKPAVVNDVPDVKPAVANDVPEVKPAVVKDIPEVKPAEAAKALPNAVHTPDAPPQSAESQESALPLTDNSIDALATDSQRPADETSLPPTKAPAEEIPATTESPAEIVDVPTNTPVQTTTPLPVAVTTESILQRSAEAVAEAWNSVASEANAVKIEPPVDAPADQAPAKLDLPDELFADLVNDSIFEQNANVGPAATDPALFAAESDASPSSGDERAPVADHAALHPEHLPPVAETPSKVEDVPLPPLSAADTIATETAEIPVPPLESSLPSHSGASPDAAPLADDASAGAAPSHSSHPDSPSNSASPDAAHPETTTPAPSQVDGPLRHREPATAHPPDPAPATPPQHTHVRDEDGQHYCIMGDCDRKIPDELPTDVWTQPAEYLPPPVGVPIDGSQSKWGGNVLRTIGSVIKRAIGFVRVILPSAFDSIDDAAVILLLILPIVIVNRLICGCLANDPKLAAFDRRRFVDVCTEKKALEIENKKLNEALKLGGNNTQAMADSERVRAHAEAQLKQMAQQMEGLHKRNADLESECDKLREEQEALRQRAEDERQRAAELTTRSKELERRSEMLDAQVGEYRTTCEEARDRADRCYDELQQKTSALAEVEAQERQLRLELSEVRADLKTTEEEVRQLRARNETLESESLQLTEMIEELNKAAVAHSAATDPNGDSGGSGGWSDIGEFDAPDHGKAETKRRRSASPGDIIDAARLRAQVKKLESDLEQARLSLQKDADSRTHTQSKLITTQEELAKRQAQLDQKEQERLETHAQCKRLFTMIEEKDAKIRAREEAAEKLRDSVDKLHDDLRHLQEQKKTSEERLKDMEQEVKRMRREYEKLETRHFHELKEIKTQNMQLQKVNTDLLTAAKSSAALDGLQITEMNASNNSSDPEMRVINSSLDPYGAPALPFHRAAPVSASVPPLWSHVAASDEYPDSPPSPTDLMPPKRTRTKSKGRSTPPEPQSKKGSRSRKSQRERSASPPVHAQPPPRIESHGDRERRRRSRSRGRLAYPALPGYAAYPTAFYDDPYYPPPPSSRTHHSGSSTGYYVYSSPGSAGGPSPPPEMPLISGVPPPGVTKKPAVTSGRPKSVHQDHPVSSRAT